MKNLIKVLLIALIAFGVFNVGVLVASAYVYNHNPSTFGGFPKSGRVRMFYSGPAGVSIKLSNYPDSDFIVTSGGRQFFDTDINVTNTARLQMIVEDGNGRAVGWIPMAQTIGPNAGFKCGSGLPDGNGGYYAIIDVTNEYNWVVQNSNGEPLVSKQCWGDWPEWSGDLDFNDFFIVFSYAPAQQILPTVDIKANGSDGPVYLSALADYRLSWESDDANTCSASGSWSGSKSVDGSQQKDNVSQGLYTYVITCSNQYGSATDTVTVNVNQQTVYGSLSINKLARDLASGQGFQDGIYVQPSREVEFSISVTNTGSSQINNLYVSDVLPSGLIYVYNSVTVDGTVMSDNIVSSGVYVGSILPGQMKTLKFRVRLQDNVYYTQSLTQMTNTAYARGDNASQVQDTASIFAVKQGQVLGAATVDTGADGNVLAIISITVFSALAFTMFQLSKRIYWKNKILAARALVD